MLRIVLVVLGLGIVAGVAIVLLTRVTAPASVLPTAKENAPIYSDLRHQALTSTRGDLGLSGVTGDALPWCVLMETGFPEGTATLVSMSDGSASLY
jgi:hypothetical protein